VARWAIDHAGGRGAVAPRVSPSSGAFHDAPIPVSCSSDPPRPPQRARGRGRRPVRART
jgi:hypothetical protein